MDKTNITGTNNKMAKLTKKQVRIIQSRKLEKKLTQKEIAVKFGVSSGIISKVANRKARING